MLSSVTPRLCREWGAWTGAGVGCSRLRGQGARGRHRAQLLPARCASHARPNSSRPGPATDGGRVTTSPHLDSMPPPTKCNAGAERQARRSLAGVGMAGGGGKWGGMRPPPSRALTPPPTPAAGTGQTAQGSSKPCAAFWWIGPAPPPANLRGAGCAPTSQVSACLSPPHNQTQVWKSMAQKFRVSKCVSQNRLGRDGPYGRGVTSRHLAHAL